MRHQTYSACRSYLYLYLHEYFDKFPRESLPEALNASSSNKVCTTPDLPTLGATRKMYDAIKREKNVYCLWPKSESSRPYQRRFHAGAAGHSPPSAQIVAWPPNLAVLLTHCGHLILRKISKFDATRCQLSRPKYTKFYFRWGSSPDPSLYLKGPNSKGKTG